jgi:hypothetical protein
MNTLLNRAVEAATEAKADGHLSIKEAVWLVAAWLAVAAEAAYRLADPTEAVDHAEMTDGLLSGWQRVRGLVDEIDLPWGASIAWATARQAVPAVLPTVVGTLAAWLDAGEVRS